MLRSHAGERSYEKDHMRGNTHWMHNPEVRAFEILGAETVVAVQGAVIPPKTPAWKQFGVCRGVCAVCSVNSNYFRTKYVRVFCQVWHSVANRIGVVLR